MTSDQYKKDTWFLTCLKEFHRTRGEELANGITHLLGIIMGVVGLTMMLVFASQYRSALYITSCAIFGTTLIILYTASTLYHFFKSFRVKSVFQLFDHCSIYLLIAGSYMPFVLLTIGQAKGWTIFGIEWGLAIIGILVEIFCSRKWANIISLPIFIVMGWLVIFTIGDMKDTLSTPAFWLLCAGGISYTVGILFYVMDKVPYMHTVWHLFVLGGSVCHWISITFFIVLPD